ncbi:hypothetical protein, partial [Burkholderia ubonensis]|uniref:hypothetical protein n=1 Tax=Burkholderia ubonensis TaxID=101571 RepID=UPI001E4AF5AC
CFQGQGVHAKSESKRDAPKVYKPRALSLLDDGLFRPTVAEARLVYKTMGITHSNFNRARFNQFLASTG